MIGDFKYTVDEMESCVSNKKNINHTITIPYNNTMCEGEPKIHFSWCVDAKTGEHSDFRITEQSNYSIKNVATHKQIHTVKEERG